MSTGFSLANQAGAGPINSVISDDQYVVVAVPASREQTWLFTTSRQPDDADFAGEVDALLDAQNGTFDGGVFVLAYSDVISERATRSPCTTTLTPMVTALRPCSLRYLRTTRT